MFLRSIKLLAASLIAALISVSCGGDSANPPSSLSVSAGDTSASVSWDMVAGVEYWLFFGPSSLTPSDTSSMHRWIGLPGGNSLIKVTSPYLVTGLANGASYSFSVNARINGGPGGAGATPVASTPRMAGGSWVAGMAGLPATQDFRAVAAATTTIATSTPIVGSTLATSTTTQSTTQVAVGGGGAMFSSKDGANWSAINAATSSRLNAISYFGTFKIVGDGGVVLASTDGTTWSAQNSATTQNLYAIASNNLNLNVAVGAGGTIITSPDGVTWSLATHSATSSDLLAVSYSGYNTGTWVAVGAGGAMVQSSDGMNWHAVVSGVSTDLYGVAAGLSNAVAAAYKFVAVGAGGTLLSSADGVNWSAQQLPAALNLNAVTYANQFVTVGAGGHIFTSTDGVNWSAASNASAQDLAAVARIPYGYVAVGAAGTNLLAK